MRIDQSHRPWLIASLVILGIAVGLYIPYVMAMRPNGGSVPGLIYGIAGYGMMLYAALLGVRKKLPVWRLGRAQTWMRGHMWFGSLAFPMILLHSGFALGGSLTSLLMALLFLVFLSGITGAAIQHFVPGMIKTMVPLETIYEQIPRIRQQLRVEADNLVSILFMKTGAVAESVAVMAARSSRDPARPDTGEMLQMEMEQREYASEIYSTTILPFLVHPDGSSVLGDPDRAAIFFEATRRRLPAVAHGVIADLENICEEERQMIRQRRLYFWLHGWLLVHVPLSIAVLILGGVHAIVALRY